MNGLTENHEKVDCKRGALFKNILQMEKEENAHFCITILIIKKILKYNPCL